MYMGSSRIAKRLMVKQEILCWEVIDGTVVEIDWG